MKSIDIMVDEHKYIKRMLKVIRKLCQNILDAREVDYASFEKAMDFVKNFADKHHHGKEEDILFKEMTEKIDICANGGPVQGMLVEHDIGRGYMIGLGEALAKVKEGDKEAQLDIIANAIGYANLLIKHIDKEDNTLYPFAERMLNELSRENVEKVANELENSQESQNTREKYIALLQELEAKVNKE